MILRSDLQPFKFSYSELDQIAYFYWMSEYILTHFYSEDYVVKVLPEVPGFGAHWGGLMIDVCNNEGVSKAICHTGLVYHPATKIGIYFEAESWKNTRNYTKLWKDVEPSPGYDLNKDETDFLKFFFPEQKIEELMNSNSVDKQMKMLTDYYDACFRGMLRAADK